MKLRSRLFTALNLLPSIATLGVRNRPICRRCAMNFAHTFRIAPPLSYRSDVFALRAERGPPRASYLSTQCFTGLPVVSARGSASMSAQNPTTQAHEARLADARHDLVAEAE
jgi:hypothetical protein